MTHSPSRFAFIVGAPRCGTTTLASFLQQHPDVCFSAVKEPHYFTQHDLAGLDDKTLRAHVEAEYLQRFFDHCEGDGQFRAEGSVTYLYAPEKMAPILKLWPDAKFVIALRDPLSMLPSLHARLLVTGDETVRDFRDAWAMIGERAEGRNVPRSAVDPRWLRYDEAGALGRHVERFMAAVGRERCHVVLFDDLIRDPRETYQELCGFLGLQPFAGTRFEAQRVNKTIRIGWLQRLLKRPPKAVRSVLAGEKYRTREKKLGAGEGKALAVIFSVRKRLLEWNKVPAPRQPLDPNLRNMIVERMRDDVVMLAQNIDRDLSHWLGGIAEAKPKRARVSIQQD
ncbi:sulfotransferase family protein [Sphingomonas xanthus]|uniref:Sulfotransferase n=1 Tax=Sphingomonas xanthus TaxID=2594473 RepID=A0A516IPK2_9SPHN|nr:sulfotransferase [Sphingomonas xanthus]QDP18831.1 sulfotransferase [Sphingomonas xanthus]